MLCKLQFQTCLGNEPSLLRLTIDVLSPLSLITETMYETGKDLRSHYRETSTGGLAKKYCRNKYYNTDME